MGTDFVHLVGAEQVERAAAACRQSVAQMEAVARDVAGMISAHEQWLIAWLDRLEQTIRRLSPAAAGMRGEDQ